MNAAIEFDGGLCSLKISFNEKSSLVFLGVSYCSFTLRTYDLKFLLGDNFFDIFFYTSLTLPASKTPKINLWFGLFPFRSPLLWESIFLSLPPGT